MMTRADPGLIDQAAQSTGRRAIVIGAGLGGLAAAMRLGAKGYQVTVIDKLDVPGGRGSAIHENGHRFDLGPTIVTVPQVFRDLWAACGRNFDKEVDLRPMDPFYEIRFADGETFTARQSTEAMRAEVARISPDDLPGYDRFLRDSEERYWFGFENLGRKPMHKWMDLVKVLHIFGRLRADRSVYAHACSRVKDERLRMALSFHPLFIGGDPFNVTSMYILVSHLEKEFGVHYAMGGVAALARAMADVVETQGGTLRMETEVDEILVKDYKARGVRLKGGEILTADVVVSNADAGFTYGQLLRNHRRWRWTDEKLDKARWSMGLFVWYFGTKGTRGLWEDVGHHTIVNGTRYKGLVRDIFFRRGQLAEDMSLYVHRPTVTDPSAAPAGDDTFYVLSPVPNLHADTPIDWAEQGERYRKMVENVLEERLLPGFAGHISASRCFTPVDFRDRYLSPFGAGFSLEPRIFQSANFRPHNISEEIGGLYMVGAGTHPGAGLPSVVTSAEVMARLVPDAVKAG
ncbi:phytoene desaturase [Rhodovulum imhoffii]|uniref:Phytoene desaturase (neurosporene-forming) n=1 Tax=Rhodovulum imhoffii TaxID=365340 RepID=A0A2T5BSQ8_9RHOB|nr:phytoene desaturase [Rhodovulum imhoffii]MBK5933440.1 phytoene dehydrogenase [Rhodovulum imhoffii]PTN02323.1 phytoene desaturase [Rhodovulum imhoffii]